MMYNSVVALLLFKVCLKTVRGMSPLLLMELINDRHAISYC